MILKDLIKNLETLDVIGDLNLDIDSIAYDSRKTKNG